MAQQNNFQDEAMVNEFKKGEVAVNKSTSKKSNSNKGKSSSKRGSRGKGGNSASRAVYPVMTGSKPLAYLDKYPQIARDTAQVTFERAVGAAIRLRRSAESALEYPTQKVVAGLDYPAVMAFDVSTTIGGASVKSDAFNLANTALYAYIRSKNTGVPPFDPPMVGLYMLAATECVKLYTHLVRALGLANWIDPNTNVAPVATVNAAGFTYADIATNSAEYRARINKMALRLSAIPIPKGMEYITVDKWLFENIFRDSNTIRAQMYVFRPNTYLTLVEGDANHPLTYLSEIDLSPAQVVNELSYVDIPTYSFGKMLNILDSMINNILGSEDCQRVAAEILKAFEGKSLIQVNPIAETFMVTPTYDENVSTVIENMTILGKKNDYYYVTYDPSINGGALIERLVWKEETIQDNPTLLNATKGQLGQRLINFHKDAVDYKDVMLATVLTTIGLQPEPITTPATDPVAVGNYYILTAHAFAVCTEAWMIAIDTTSASRATGTWMYGISRAIASYRAFEPNMSFINMMDYIDDLSKLSAFDWHPTIMPFRITTDSQIQYNAMFVDLDKYALVGEEVLRNIHDAAVLSGYSSTELGVYSLK